MLSVTHSACVPLHDRLQHCINDLYCDSRVVRVKILVHVEDEVGLAAVRVRNFVKRIR